MMQSAPPHTGSLWDALALRLDANRPRPRARPGIEEHQLITAHGVPYLIVRSPDGRTFLRLTSWQSAVLRAMDGTHTMRDLLLVHLEQRGVLEPSVITTLVALLYAHGFVEGAEGDCYRELAVRLRPGGRSGGPRRAIAAIGRSWELPTLGRAVASLCTVSARLPRTRAILILALLLGVAGILAPLLAVFVGHASLGDGPGTLLAIGLALWAAPIIYAIGAGIGSSLVGYPPRRAGVRLFAGIPVLWLDARECLAAGRAGSRAVWLAGPLALLCAAGVAGLAAMTSPVHHLALALALTWALPAVWLLAPPSLQGDETPDAGPSMAVLRRDRWWLQWPWQPVLPSARQSSAWSSSILVCLLWIGSVLALIAVCWRAGLPDPFTAPWHAGSVLGAAIVVVLAAHVASCATVQFILPAVRRWGTPEGIRQFRERHPPAIIRRRLAILDRCEALAGLTAQQRLALAHRLTEVQYPHGFDVVVQGEVGDDFYIVFEGTAEAIDEGGPTVLEHYGPGDSFGKYALIYHALRAATVRATSDLRLLRVNRTIFDLYLARRFMLQERLAALADERRILTGVPLLRNLDAQALDLLLPLLIGERHGPGAVIIRQGEPGEHFYIVKSGTVEIVDESHTPPRRLNVLGNGEYFGEIALLLDQPRVATVRALVEVTVWRLSRTDFNVVLGRYLGLDASLAGAGQARLTANSNTGA